MDSEAPRLRVLAAVGLMAVGFVGLELWLWLSFGLAPWPLVLSGIWAGSCFIVAGIAAWRLRPRSAIGLWMLVLGFVILIEVLNTGLRLPSTFPGRELTVLVGVPANWLAFAIASQLFLSYPSGRLPGRLERLIVTVGFVVAGAGSLFLLLTRTPVPAVCSDWCGPSPIALVQDAQLYLGIRSAIMVTWVGLAVIVLGLLFRRAKQSTRRQRRLLSFAIVAAVLTVLTVVAAQIRTLALYSGVGDPDDALFLDIAARWLVVAALPVAFLVGLLRERLEFASVGDLVRKLEHVGAGRVEAALGEVLHDPTLRVVFPTEGGWLDLSGASYEPGGHAVTKLGGDPPVAALVHEPGLAEQPELLAAAGAAARLALDNARLHAEVRAQLAEVRASRQRIAAAADNERQRLERDLHDGAQQRLLGIGLTLGMLRGRLASTEDRAVVTLLEEELRAAIRELRDVAHGIRPAVLTDQGLVPALAGLARRAGVPVSLDVQLTGRLAPIVESTVYHVVSEALQNIVKHARAATARVQVAQDGDMVAVEVSDDGCGGVSPSAGTGLRGLADRVDAVGGRFAIESPPGVGTVLRANLPCSAGQFRDHDGAL